MASVTIDLTGFQSFTNYILWSDNQSLGTVFDANGAEQVFTRLDLNNIGPAGQVFLSIVGTNNRFTPAFEASGRIVFEASDGEILEVTIGDADTSEPYSWVPTNGAEVVAFVLHVKGLADQAATLTLTDEDDEPEPEPEPTTVPDRPTGLAAAAAIGSVPLTWDDPGDASITSYQILRRDTTGGETSIAVHINSAPAGAGYTDTTDVADSNTYRYRIKARNTQGLSLQSAFVDVTTLAGVEPEPEPVTPATPTRAAVKSWAINATMFGNDIDLTPYVAEATWKHGSRPPNHFGHMADPAVGALTLLNLGGEFKTFDPDPFVDTSPGSPIQVEYDGIRLFTGKSGTMLNQVLLTGDTAVMPMLGPLGFLARFAEGIFARLDGVQRTDEVFALVLEDAGYDGPTFIDRGRTRLLSSRLNRSNLLGSGRMRTQVLGALRTIVQAEVGRGYDNRLGQVVFENRTHRSTHWASNPAVLRLDHTNSVIERASIPSVDDSIVNIISGTGDSYVTLGVQDIDFTIALPFTFDVLPGGRTILLNVDSSGSTEFIQSWEDLARGTDYTYTLDPDDPIIARGALTLGIYIPNPSPTTQTFKLIQVRGEPFGINIRERIDVRRQSSIDAYGPRPLIYPSDLVADLEDIQDHLEWAVALHDGIDGKGRKDLSEVRALQAVVNLLDPDNAPVIGVDVGSLVGVTEPRLGVVDAPFWVESAEYEVVADPYAFRVTLELSDARASMMWALGRMRFGFNTRVGF